MGKVYFGFAIADSMFPAYTEAVRRLLSLEQVKELIGKGVIPCLNPSHEATIQAMEEKFDIKVAIAEVAPKIELKPYDSLIVMSVRGLPRLTAERHEYTTEEIEQATFQFSLWKVKDPYADCIM